MADVAVFIDTNALYDYSDITNIKWHDHDILPKTGQITIVITMVNIRELNNHKDGTKIRLYDRASSLLKLLHTLADSADSNGLSRIGQQESVYFETVDPIVEPPLNPNINDDHLIANMLYRKKHHPGEEIRIVTGDRGLSLKLKAEEYGFKELHLPSRHESTPPRNPLEDRVAVLEKQNKLLKERVPDIVLQFAGQADEGSATIIRPLSANEVENTIRNALSDNPPIIEAPPSLRPAKTTLATSPQVEPKGMSLEELVTSLPEPTEQEQAANIRELSLACRGFMLTNSQIAEFNEQLESFYLELEKYWSDAENIDYENGLRRVICTDMDLKNVGGGVATDIAFSILLPEGTHAFETVPVSRAPHPPDAPTPTIASLTGIRNQNSMLHHELMLAFDPPNSPPANVIRSAITESGRIVAYHIRKLQPGAVCKLGSIHLRLPAECNDVVTLKYHASADEIAFPEVKDAVIRITVIGP